jgi:transposase
VYIEYTTLSFIRKIRVGSRIYLAEVESKRVDGKVIQRHIRYVGREADGKTILSSSISDVTIDKVKLHGPLLVLNHLAQEIGLSEVLGDYGDEILSLVYAHCLDYKSINHMTQWFERTDLNMILDLEELTEHRLLSALDSLEEQNQGVLQRRIFENVCKRYDLDTKGLVYDVTNTYLYGKKCPLGKWGKDKDGVLGRPLIQIGLGVTQKEGVPVFHKTYEGNIHDSRTFQDAITLFEDYKIKDGMVVFDRGIPSEKNCKDVEALGWRVLCGLKADGGLKSFVSPILKNKSFLDLKHRVKLGKRNVFYVLTRPYAVGKVRGTLALCFNERKKHDLKESRYDEIEEAQDRLSEGKIVKEGLEVLFSKSGHLIPARLVEEEALDGYSFIFTTARLSPSEMVRLYFDKDLVEKAFQSLKGVVRLRPIRHWLYNRVVAHVFICYLAYLLLSLLKLRLKKLEMSPVAALQELDTLYKVYMRDSRKGFELSRVVALSKQQEKIMKTIDKKLLSQCSV